VVETLRCVQIVNTTEEHKTKNYFVATR